MGKYIYKGKVLQIRMSISLHKRVKNYALNNGVSVASLIKKHLIELTNENRTI